MKTGIYPGMGMAEYHGWKLDKAKLIDGPISCSMLKRFAQNPYAWRWSPDFKQTEAMATGSLFDAALTDSDALSDNYVFSEFSDFRTKAAKEWKTEMEATGKTIVLEHDFNHAIEAAKRCREHKVAGPLLDGAEFQVGVIGEAEVEGYSFSIPAKCLIDVLPAREECLVDYKTISTGLDDKSIREAIGKYKYHWQAAFYLTLFNKVATDQHAKEFKFIFQNPTTLEIRVVTLSADAFALGTVSVKLAVKEFLRCAKQGIKSRYEATDEEIDLMPYHTMAEDEWQTAQIQ